MKKFVLLATISVCFLAACKKNSSSDTISIKKTETIQGNITSNKTLDPNVNYVLTGQVYVKNNAVLTIPAGVTINMTKFSDMASKSCLIITRGSKIMVNGTADKPVVFTSAEGVKTQGDWGALIILGNAPTNVGIGNVEGLPVSADTQYGGTNASDNSGSINYLRLEYCGGLNPPAEDEWIVDKAAGLCLASVGSGTHIDNVMVEHSNDDGFQFVGGTVNATHLIAYNNGDDDFDFDLGYTGNLQFIIGYRTVASSQALRANGLESYNDEVPTTNTPLTRPVISNATIIGPQGVETVKTNLNQGVYMRKGTRLMFFNSIVAEYPQGALMVCFKTRPVVLADAGSEFRYNLVETDNPQRDFTWDINTSVIADPVLETFELNSPNNNTEIPSSAAFNLKAMYTNGAPDLTPQSGSAALTGANFSSPDYTNSFFTAVTYRGAIGNTNWAAPSNWAVWE